MKKSFLFLVLIALSLSSATVMRADELNITNFPKMQECDTLVYQSIGTDTKPAKHSARVLQGIVNRERAELFLADGSADAFWFQQINKPYRRVTKRITSGTNPALRSLFGEYYSKIDKLVVCDFYTASYTWNMGVMMACVENALPVSEEIKDALIAEFPQWKGEVVDIRNQWESSAKAYDWAISELLPKMNKRIVFSLGMRSDWENGEWKAYDYAVATRSFTFFLDNHTTEGADLIRRILREGGYEKNATVMGYGMHGDDLNDVTNPEGFGYVVGDFIPNVSLYCSLPSIRIEKPKPTPVTPEADKVYVALHFSDGDNIFFDHNSGLDIYRNSSRGKVPVSMTLAPSLTELAPFILKYYYDNATDNDELIGGPSGFQFIQESLYKTTDYNEWCRKNSLWLDQAGMNTTASSLKWPVRPFLNNGFLKSGINGTLAWSNGDYSPAYDWFGMPVVVTGGVTTTADEVIKYLSGINPDGAPAFTGVYMVQAGFGASAYEAAVKVKETMDAQYPGKYVFLKASDLLLTAKAWFDSKRAVFKSNKLPGIVEVEDFDLGGKGVAYDNASGSNNHSYRSDADGVTIDGDNSLRYVNATTNQWMSYTVNVETAGLYELSISLTSPGAGTLASVMLDGDYLMTIDAPAHSDFRTYKSKVNLPSTGTHELRIFFYQWGVKADYMSFALAQTAPAAIEVDDLYQIVAKHSNKALVPANNSSTAGTNIVQKAVSSDDEYSMWSVMIGGDAYYNIKSYASSKYMSCRGGKRVQIMDFDNASTLQQWAINYVDDKYFYIVPRGTGKCIEVPNASQNDGAMLQLNDFSGADNQLFYLEKVTSGISDVPFPVGGQVADDHAYNLQGQQVNSSFRGLVIKDGRKYIIR